MAACAQVLINVKAVGLNFRDVLNVLGLYPGDPGDPGGDCAGTIAAVGSAAAAHHRLVPDYSYAVLQCWRSCRCRSTADTRVYIAADASQN